MMINSVETIRKMMGWCPDASVSEGRKTSIFENLTINEPQGDAGSTYITPRWWNKYHNLVLLVSICLTLLSIKWFILPEINKLDFVLAIVFTGVLFTYFILGKEKQEDDCYIRVFQAVSFCNKSGG